MATKPATPAVRRTFEIDFPNGGEGLANATILHPRYVQCREQVLEYLDSPADVEFVFIPAPAGAGKSNLVERVTRRILDDHREAMLEDPDLLPVLDVDVPPPNQGTFPWKTFAMWIHVRALDPSGGRRRMPLDSIASQYAFSRRHSANNIDVMDTAFAAAANRGVKTLMLDESGHLAQVVRSKHNRQQLDILKSAATRHEMRLVFAGPYELLDFRDASSQVSRRSRTAPLTPYSMGVARERQAWETLVNTVVDLLGQPIEMPDLAAWLHAGSLGCVGVLRDWLAEAEHIWRRRGGRQTFTQCVREFRPESGKLAAMQDEIELGLARIAADHRGPVSSGRRRGVRAVPTTLAGQQLRPGEAQPRRNYLSKEVA